MKLVSLSKKQSRAAVPSRTRALWCRCLEADKIKLTLDQKMNEKGGYLEEMYFTSQVHLDFHLPDKNGNPFSINHIFLQHSMLLQKLYKPDSDLLKIISLDKTVGKLRSSMQKFFFNFLFLLRRGDTSGISITDGPKPKSVIHTILLDYN